MRSNKRERSLAGAVALVGALSWTLLSGCGPTKCPECEQCKDPTPCGGGTSTGGSAAGAGGSTAGAGGSAAGTGGSAVGTGAEPGGPSGVIIKKTCAGGCAWPEGSPVRSGCLVDNPGCFGGVCRADLKLGNQCIENSTTKCIKPDGTVGKHTCSTTCQWGDCL
jgi:hypothetical protein